LIRARPIRAFRRQVLGYIIISGLIGAVALTAAYTATYLASNRDTPLAQTVMTIVAVIYGILIFWDVHGVVPFEPVTFKHNRREAVVGIGVAIVALAVPLWLWQEFQIALIPLPYWAGIAALTLVTALVLWRSTFEQPRILAPLRALLTK
jgi:hypothetical protein